MFSLRRFLELSTGLKIKAALNRVNEDSLVAIFDDDDFYAKDYLTFMEGQLRKEGADLVKLQNWDFFDGVPIEGLPNYKGTKLVGEFWELDLKIATEHQAIFGYGFTYFFKRSVALKGKFATKHGRSGWDSTWTQSLEDLGFNLKPVRGKPHIVIKIQHGSNASLQVRLIGCFATNAPPLALNNSTADGSVCEEGRPSSLQCSQGNVG